MAQSFEASFGHPHQNYAASGAAAFKAHVEAATGGDCISIRWTGVGFERLELLHLFDFLFTDQKQAEHADISLLARGINALLHFEPTEISIFVAGDELTDNFQVNIDPKNTIVESVLPFDRFRFYVGVCVEVRGMRGLREFVEIPRIKPEELPIFQPRRSGPLNPYSAGNEFGELIRFEQWLLQQRLWFPGQVVLDGQSLLSDPTHQEVQRRKHSPQEEIFIDEPDLHGQIWPCPDHETAGLDLVTWGIVVERLQKKEFPFDGVRGTVTFNELTKTADHARIVRDGALVHLWARLKPYVERLQDGGRGRLSYGITDFSGRTLGPEDFRATFDRFERLIVLEPEQAEDEAVMQRACQLLDVHQASGIIAPPEEMSTILALVQERLQLLAMGPDTVADLEFFLTDPEPAPPRPWFIEPVDAPPMASREFFGALSERFPDAERLIAGLPESFLSYGSVRLRIYTPDDARAARGEKRSVQLRIWDRLISQEATTQDIAGHEIVIDLPPLAPSLLPEALRNCIAEFAVERARPYLEEATALTLRRLSHMDAAPGSLASRLALRHLAGVTIMRLRRLENGGNEIVLEPMMHNHAPWLKTTPLVETFSGRPIGLAELVELLRLGQGLIHGAPPDFDPAPCPDFEEDIVLRLDDEQERLIVEIVGEDNYIRVGAAIQSPSHTTFQTTQTAISLEDLRDAAGLGRPILMSESRALLREEEGGREDAEEPVELLTDPFVLHLVEKWTLVEPSFDCEPPRANESASTDESGWLLMHSIESKTWRGRVGIPTKPVPRPAIAVIETQPERCIHGRQELARLLGIIGRIELVRPSSPALLASLEAELKSISRACHLELIDILPTIKDARRRARMLDVLLDYAGSHLSISERTNATLRLETSDDIARRIVDLPFFTNAQEHPTNAASLIDAARHSLKDGVSTLELPHDLPPQIHTWLKNRHRLPGTTQSLTPSPTTDHPIASRDLQHWFSAQGFHRPNHAPLAKIIFEPGRHHLEHIELPPLGQLPSPGII
ncbi:MAG: hypothetical protein ACNA8W_17655, partial [Bradymonadaceae bacterium]